MDLFHPLQAVGGLLSSLLLYNLCKLFARFIKTGKSNSMEAPEVAGKWPVIGHLHLLRGRELLYQKLGAMADKYGPAFTLQFGMRRTLVVSSWEAVKDCFSTNDKVLASHPNSAMGEYMCYNYAMLGVAPYGPYWRDIRKISMLHLLSNSRLDVLKHVRGAVIDAHIKELYQLCVENSQRPVKVEIKKWFGEVSFNLIVKMVVGKQFFGTIDAHEESEARRFRKAIEQFFQLAVAFVLSDVFPFLKWMDLDGKRSAMKRVAEELDSIMVTYMEEHRRKRLSGEAKDEDFMDVMFSVMEDSQFSSYDPDTIIKSNSLSLVLGGTDTTAVTLTVALSFLLSNPSVLLKAQEELDIHVGKGRNVDESDVKNLVYLQAIIKETLRLSPTTSLLPWHEASEDCKISGYFVPSGTYVLVNSGKLHRDPCIWSDPFEFRPERFLTRHDNVDVRGQQFEYTPFGSGRRICAGISFALQVMHLTLARLLHGFELARPTNAPIDIESLSIGNPKPTPVDVLIVPRLPLDLY